MEFGEQSMQKRMGKCCHKNMTVKGALDLEEREMKNDYLDEQSSDRKTTHANFSATLLRLSVLIGNKI